jgi:DNA-binding CsgD family transcriptional regulator
MIAASMGLRIHTTHDHVKSVYRKLGVRSRAELMATARHFSMQKKTA